MKNKMKLPTTIAPKVLTQVQGFKEHQAWWKEKYKSDIFEYRWKRINFYLNLINAALGREITIVSKLHKSSEEIEYMFNVFVNGEYDVLASFEIMNDRDYFLQLLEERYELDLETHLVKEHGLEWSRELNDYVNKKKDS